MFTTVAILIFSIIAILVLLAFGLVKLQPLSKERICVCTNINEDDRAAILCDRFNEILPDFRERRNEFWNCFGQFTVIIVIITLLVILLLLDKISSEAALPIISGLGCFGIGKSISRIKSNPGTYSPHNEPPKKEKEEEK